MWDGRASRQYAVRVGVCDDCLTKFPDPVTDPVYWWGIAQRGPLSQRLTVPWNPGHHASEVHFAPSGDEQSERHPSERQETGYIGRATSRR